MVYKWHLAIPSTSAHCCLGACRCLNWYLKRPKWRIKFVHPQAATSHVSCPTPCRGGLHVLRVALPPQSDGAVSAGIKTYPCIVFWDLDNVTPKNRDSIEQICNTLKAATARATGQLVGKQLTAADVFILAYCNKNTLKKCAVPIEALMAISNVLVIPVAASRQSADQAIIADMTAIAVERGSAVAIALVSCDAGFSATLRHCRGRGCPTVSISRVLRRPGTAEVSKRALLQWQRQQLPAAADVALCWENMISPKEEAEPDL